MSLSGRVAVITGAAQGMGFEIARRLGLEGAAVILVDVNETTVNSAAATLVKEGVEATAYAVDLGEPSEIERFLGELGERSQNVDILVNNAGVSPKHNRLKARVKDMQVSEFDRVIAVNLRAPFLLARAFSPGMCSRKWGRIVNITSEAARTWQDTSGAHYAASKAGLTAFSWILAREVGLEGVTVNCIAPGRIATPMANNTADEIERAYVASIPVGRVGTPAEIAATVLFLTSDEAGFVTGATVDVNGGRFMH